MAAHTWGFGMPSTAHGDTMRRTTDDLANSTATPPPDAMSVAAAQGGRGSSRSLFSAWTDRAGTPTQHAPAGDAEPGETRPKSFMEAFRASEQRSAHPELEGYWDEPSDRLPVPPAPGARVEVTPPESTEPPLRTALNTGGTGPPGASDGEVSAPPAGTRDSVPIATAAAAALARLSEEPDRGDETGERRRKKKDRESRLKDPTKKRKKSQRIKSMDESALSGAHLGTSRTAEPIYSDPPRSPTSEYSDAPRPRAMHSPIREEAEEELHMVPTSTRAPEPEPVRAAPVPEPARAGAFHFHMSRLAINAYILYRGLFLMLRKVWRWERPWLTGAAAAFYLVVWWRGELMLVFLLFAFFYLATFRLLHTPPEEALVDANAEERALVHRGRDHSLAVSSLPRHASQNVVTVYERLGEHVVAATRQLADAHERVKNFALWRYPLVTLRYLGWIIVLMIISTNLTAWMVVRLPGAAFFLLFFVVAPLVEYGHWRKVVDVLSEMHDRASRGPAWAPRAPLDYLLAPAPTDAEFIQREARSVGAEPRRTKYLELAPAQIVEEEDVPRPRRRRRDSVRVSRTTHRPLMRYEDALEDAAEEEQVERARAERTLRRRSLHRVPSRSEPDVFSDFSNASVIDRDEAAQGGPLFSSWPPRAAEEPEQPAMSEVHGPSGARRQSLGPAWEYGAAPPASQPVSAPLSDPAAPAPVSPAVQPVQRSATPGVGAEPAAPASGYPSTNPFSARSFSAPGEPQLTTPHAAPIARAASTSGHASPHPGVSVPRHFVPAHSAELARQQRLQQSRQRSYESLTAARQPSLGSLRVASEQSAVSMSPAVPSEGHEPARASPLPERPRSAFGSPAAGVRSSVVPDGFVYSAGATPNGAAGPSPNGAAGPSLYSATGKVPAGGVFLAVFRKRVGHLVVLPHRVVFQQTHSPVRPLTRPAGLTDEEEARLTKTVDGREYYPLVSSTALSEMLREEMSGGALTAFERAPAVASSLVPTPWHVLFAIEAPQITGLKKTRKNTPLLDGCTEGIELVVRDGQSVTVPVVVRRDEAFRLILGLQPQRWA